MPIEINGRTLYFPSATSWDDIITSAKIWDHDGPNRHPDFPCEGTREEQYRHYREFGIFAWNSRSDIDSIGGHFGGKLSWRESGRRDGGIDIVRQHFGATFRSGYLTLQEQLITALEPTEVTGYGWSSIESVQWGDGRRLIIANGGRSIGHRYLCILEKNAPPLRAYLSAEDRQAIAAKENAEADFEAKLAARLAEIGGHV